MPPDDLRNKYGADAYEAGLTLQPRTFEARVAERDSLDQHFTRLWLDFAIKGLGRRPALDTRTRLLVLIAEFDRRGGWSDGLTQSCAHWLNWKCGVGMGAAREKVRVARALESLPKVAAAMESGRLSYSKAREITRVATSETEDHS